MSSMNSMRLKELIRTVRLCKTSAEERALVNREFSSIKEGFKAGTPYLRNRNMLKLLYLSMLGYPVQFGQLEVINLLAQEDFSGKRIGYLAMQLILSENDEVLTLVENNMKNDMAARGPLGRLVQGVALNAAANIAGVDMARDIFDEVSTLIKAELAVIRKKAFLAALTIVRKVPEYAEYFLEQCLDTVFAEGSHSVQTSELALIITCLQTKDGPAFLPRYRRLATAAARRLRSLVVGGKTSEQEVSGVAEPFLQVRLLQFMAVIGRESSATSEALSDTLAQVITNTDLTRIIGCAVTYECVRTIYALESDDGLRTLAINTIGRFLTGAKDNNLRFVALKALKQLATSHAEVVQFHHTQILDCLKDSDISIRRRALDLIVDIVTEANVRMLVPDMLVYLSMGTGGLREEVNRCVSSIIENKSPSDEWRVELSLRLLKFSRQFAKEDFAHQLIGVISTLSEEAKLRSLKQMWYEAGAPFDALQESRRVLLMVCVWSIGEYSDLLVAHHSLEPITIIQNLTDIAAHAVSPVLKQYCAMAVVKTVARFPDSKEEALKMFEVYRKSSIWDLRQRSAEFKAMIEGFPDEAAFAFSRMPPIHTTEEYHVPVMTVTADELHGLTPAALDDLFGTANPDAPQRVELDALFAAEPSMIPVASPTNTSPLTGSDPVFQREAVFRCDDFSVYLDHTRDGGVIHARVAILSSAVEAIENLSFQVAVPKTCVVEVFPLAATGISPGTVLMQLLDVNIAAYAKSQLALKVKIVYCIRGESREQTFQASRDV